MTGNTPSRAYPAPLELRDGKLVFLLPLEAGGRELISCTRGIGNVEGDILCITIPDRLAAEQGIQDGSVYVLWDDNGEFVMEALDQ